jgi:hypothetical protein
LKQDNRDIFDIDFNTKKNNPIKKSPSSDFFDFSMSENKTLSDKAEFLKDTDETEFAVETHVIVEDSPFDQDETPVEESLLENDSPLEEESPIEDESPAEDESPVEEEAPVEEEVPTVEESITVEEIATVEEPTVAEIPSPAITSVTVEDTAKIEDDSVSITKVNWHKKAQTNAPLYDRTNVSPTSVSAPSPSKKKSLVIDTDDGFEIKICDFRGLANK